MKQCLVTTLRESVVNDSLLKLGELRFTFNQTMSAKRMTLGSAIIGQSLRIIGNGDFTDVNGVVIGKTIIPTIDTVYLSAPVTNFSISNKYTIQNIFNFGVGSMLGLSNNLSDFKFLKGLMYVSFENTSITGDIINLKESALLNVIILINPLVTGDISVLSNFPALTAIWAQSTPNIKGDISVLGSLPSVVSVAFSGINIRGNISILANRANLNTLSIAGSLIAKSPVTGTLESLGNLPNLTSLTIIYSNIGGDISKLASFPKLASINLTGSLVTGNLSSVASMNTVTGFSISETSVSGNISALSSWSLMREFAIKFCNTFTGNLNSFHNNLVFFSNSNGASTFTYTTGTRTNILACEDVRITSGADQFLIDMANCTLNPISQSSWYKTISIYATVTSASASAITTLQGKGVTVSIRPL